MLLQDAMSLKDKGGNMKINYSEIKNENPYVTAKCIYRFKIEKSILKKHYKALARMSMLFNHTERNAGFIRKENKQKFLDLLEEIEKSNSKKAAASHEKAAAKYKKKNYKCEHEDLGSLGYVHGETVKCPHCGQLAVVW